jgi:hypothetical protein
MPQTKHISEGICTLFAKGDLPDKVRVKKAQFPFRFGQVLTWTGEGYEMPGSVFIFYAFLIRREMGEIFEPVTDHSAGISVAA